jgi:protein TonB
LPVPGYPEVARAAKAEGEVDVRIMINEEGKVIGAEAISGHPLLRDAAVKAAREAKFAPTRLQGEPVRVSGTLTYNFLVQ